MKYDTSDQTEVEWMLSMCFHVWNLRVHGVLLYILGISVDLLLSGGNNFHLDSEMAENRGEDND